MFNIFKSKPIKVQLEEELIELELRKLEIENQIELVTKKIAFFNAVDKTKAITTVVEDSPPSVKLNDVSVKSAA